MRNLVVCCVVTSVRPPNDSTRRSPETSTTAESTGRCSAVISADRPGAAPPILRLVRASMVVLLTMLLASASATPFCAAHTWGRCGVCQWRRRRRCAHRWWCRCGSRGRRASSAVRRGPCRRRCRGCASTSGARLGQRLADRPRLVAALDPGHDVRQVVGEAGLGRAAVQRPSRAHQGCVAVDPVEAARHDLRQVGSAQTRGQRSTRSPR